MISRQLIDDTQSRNFKEAAKYLPLVSFQEMQGPEVLRPETRGMQGSNMQNDRKDGMGIAVTTPSALEEYEQIEVVNGLGGPLYGPANPSGMFNFVTKRPTEERLGEIELGYEGDSVGTIHTDLGGRFGKNRMFGYRTNLLLADGNGYVDHSQLRRQLAAGGGRCAPDVPYRDRRELQLLQFVPARISRLVCLCADHDSAVHAGIQEYSVARQMRRIRLCEGYGQSFSGVDLTSQIGEVRVKHDFSANWHLVVGALNQISDRNINTAVNQLIDNSGNYKSYLANSFSSLAPRFHVDSDLAYLTGSFKPGDPARRRDRQHWLPVRVLLARHQPRQNRAVHGEYAARCLPGEHLRSAGLCGTAGGLFSYAKTSPSTGIYGSSIIRQQGFSFGDTITLTPRWLVRVAASQDWTWTDSYHRHRGHGLSERHRFPADMSARESALPPV